jgi:metallo-beta-lactamase family protein
MAQLTFFGATGMVTGSRHLFELDGRKLLIDCGLFQGPKEHRLKNWEPFPVPPADIDAVFLTHAHIDHSGYLPRFCQDDFAGPVYCTHPTADLCEILLRDSAHLQQEDARWANKKGFSKHKPALPLYTIKDAEKALDCFKPVYYGDDVYLSKNTRVKFKDAGHILGSSIIDVKTTVDRQSRKIVFSGDLGRPGGFMLRDTAQVFNVDYLVLESTYGDRLHEDVDRSAELGNVIRRSVERGGVLLIPAFAVGRTQDLLYTIRELEEKGDIPSLPVYVDSPMAIDATEIFKRRLSDLNLETRILNLEGKRFLQPREVYFCRSRSESKAINEIKKGAIIISASGMAVGGRILHHLVHRLSDAKNTVLFVGYQVDGTRGRLMIDGHPTIKIHGQKVAVRAAVENIFGFSAHADYHGIAAWLMGFNRPPQKTFIVHGEPEASAALAEWIHARFGWEVVVPEYGDSFELEW